MQQHRGMPASRGSALYHLLLLLSLLLPALPAAALSLGDMVIRSLPGSSLRGHIPLTLQDDELLEELEIRLATDEEYAGRNVPRAEVLRGLRFALMNKGEGRARLQIYGREPWLGGEAQLLVVVKWPKGDMMLPYRLAAISPAKATVPDYLEVQQDDSLDAIAIRLSRGRNRSYLHMMYALFLANPDAFYRGNMNNLKSGARMRVPTETELFRLTDREVFAGIRRQYAEWQKMRESKQRRGTEAGEVLSAMSDEQTALLDLSGDAEELQRRLQQVNAEGEAVARENEELRQRLSELERQVETMAGEVLDYAQSDLLAPSQATSTGEAAAVNESDAATQLKAADLAGEETVQKKQQKEEKKEAEEVVEQRQGLPGWGLLLAIVLVLLAVFYLYSSVPRLPRDQSGMVAQP